ncbi:hypothetical protein [Nocardiopsis lambiniae]|uniref:Uncharacterized protein n=1 Tax=Nocardiopsis lambiniae TaxID=3075539 RepID=A0ABU2ME73_9ACTN|nr:hypothetical protein [Nocardiopsis sp. DSM 44743]MDT0330922.1 hypothetical protein [Nocardiopsis sp. DSM 44743]
MTTDPTPRMPDDLTPAERDAVLRQGRVIADQRAAGAPLLGDPDRDYRHGD